MPSDTADILLAAARGLRLRQFMGSIPFDVDQWMRQDLDCDLPRLADTATGYHFSVRDVNGMGSYFRLYVDTQGEPRLEAGIASRLSDRIYSADMDGWRAVVAGFNQKYSRGSQSPIVQKIYIYWGNEGFQEVHRLAAQTHALLEQVYSAMFGDDGEQRPDTRRTVRSRLSGWLRKSFGG